MNDDIDEALCSVAYATFKEAIVKVKTCSRRALLAKADIKSAFSSLGFYFEDCYFFDKCLPMGCSLSCTYFKTFSTFLHWVLCFKSGLDAVVHYLDDVLFFRSSGFQPLFSVAAFVCHYCRTFGVPLATKKTCLPVMGILMETEFMEFSLL